MSKVIYEDVSLCDFWHIIYHSMSFLIGAFSPLTLKVIIDTYVFIDISNLVFLVDFLFLLCPFFFSFCGLMISFYFMLVFSSL